MKNPVSNKRGFTLVEALVTMAILGIVITGVYNVYIYLHKTWLAESIKAEMQQKARVAINTMTQDMMMMGYGTGAIGSYSSADKILIADTTQLQFRAYLDKMATPGEYTIKYYLSGHDLWKEIRLSSAASGDTYKLAENLWLPDLSGAPGLAFKYYKEVNGSLQEITSLPVATQSELNDIRRITVTMSMRSAKAMPGTTTDYKYITLTADISPKNLWEGEMVIDHESPAFSAANAVSLHVVNTGKCGLLKAKWGKATDNIGVAGYKIQFSTSSGGVPSYKTVLVSQISDPENPQAEFSVDYSPYTGPSTIYYVSVCAFDAAGNNSGYTNEVYSVSPFANLTGFSQSGNCTINLVRKPGAVPSFSATGAAHSIQLSWSAPSDSNVVGYRIFRSYSSFNASNFPINSASLPTSIKQLTKESESGDGWAGGRTDLGVTSYIDSDSALMGCTPYFYAICPVTCDRTRIMGDASHITVYGGRYTSAQYSFASASPLDTTKPGDPVISSAAGWKRVFLNINWPTDNDYKYTRVYFNTGTNPPSFDPANPGASDSYLIPDRQADYSQGTFFNHGTSSEHTIIFNCTNSDLADDAQPRLDIYATYAFRAVAFDKCDNPSNSVTGVATTMQTLCGDDPCGAPTWNAARYVWVDGAATNLDASTWNNNATDGNTQINIGLKWTSVDTTDAATAADFWGYYVSRNLVPSLSSAFALASTEWNNYVESAGLAEGSVYYYGIRAADCVYHNMAPEDPPITAKCGGVDVTESYTEVRANNITSAADTLWSGAIKPGRVAKYTRTDTAASHPEYNFVTTEGDFHNKVRFYLTNTSQASLKVDWMKLLWGNSAAHLKTVTIGPLDDGTTYTYSPGLISNTSATQINMGAVITNLATSTTMTSDKIPVLLEFVNSDNSVNAFDNMSREVITLEISFTNTSMPNAAGSASGVSGFTTGVYNGSNPLMLVVSGGPSVNYVNQNKPANPTTSFEISDASTLTSLPAGYPTVNGGTNVTVTANITKPSTETIGDAAGGSGVKIHYVFTDLSATNPGTAIPSTVDATASGNDYSADIPGATNQGVWYYVTATTLQGNSVRSPENPDSFYYYKQLSFDPCLEVPNAPTGLGGTPSSLTWTAPTAYISGSDIPSGDRLTYNVYRKIGLTGDFPVTPLNSVPLTSTSYNDTTYSLLTSPVPPVSYAVTAVNSCTSRVNASALSNILIVCPTSGSGCSLVASPVNIYAGQPVSLNVAICSAANNGVSGETGVVTATTASGHTLNLTVTEIGDTGTAAISIPTTMSSSSSGSTLMLPVIGVGQYHDTITVTAQPGDATTHTLFLGACSGVTATVGAYANKCNNIPAAPTLSGSIASSGKISFTWTAVTQNTDGSPVAYTAPAPLEGDSLVTYELWYSQGSIPNSSLSVYTDPNSDISGWIKVPLTEPHLTTTAPDAVSISNRTKYKFTVRALDACGQGMFSNLLSIINP